MANSKSSFGRLDAAWSARPLPRRPATGDQAHTGADDDLLGPVDSSEAPWVLVARRATRAPETFHCGLLASARFEDRIYRIDPVTVATVDEIGRLCRARTPRVMVVDIELIVESGITALQNLRRRTPGTDWLLAWNAPPAGLDVAVLSQMRGCIDWAIGPLQLARAVDALAAGEMWFPRAVVEALYRALLGSTAAAPAPGTIPTMRDLTRREAEVLVLMRQGLSNKQIAERLNISVNTIKKHLATAFEKRGITKRRQALD